MASADGTEPAGGSSANDQGGKNAKPTDTRVRKSNKICAFFKRAWKAVKKSFQKNRVEPIGVSEQPHPEPPCEPGPSGRKSEPEMDLADVEESSCEPGPNNPISEPEVDLADTEPSCEPGPNNPISEPEVDLLDAEPSCKPGPSGPKSEPEVDLLDAEPSCKPGPNGPEPAAQVTTKPSVSQKHLLQRVFQLKRHLKECTLDRTPVTEVWLNVFIGTKETAMDRDKLKEMGITHILNAAAVKKNLRVLLGIPNKEDLKGTISTGAKYYKGMNITYTGVPVRNKYWFKISRFFYKSAEFIHKALNNPENKVLVHCKKGSSRSVTLFLAYLMIHQDMMVEDAIDHVMRVRRINPNIGFLKQLLILDSKLIRQRKLQFTVQRRASAIQRYQRAWSRYPQTLRLETSLHFLFILNMISAYSYVIKIND